jgi:hypothetical protein
VTNLQEAFDRLKKLPAQTQTEVMRGVSLRKRRNGQSVLRLHYSSIPERDPETEEGQKWFRRERKNYSSKSNWNKEQEIDPYSSGGEQVFGHIFGEHYQVVVISDPNWYPKPEWEPVGGFDHGKRNATALLKAYVTRAKIDPITGKAGLPDIYVAGEYYSMQRDGWANEVKQNVPEILKMPDIERMRWIRADPTIFPDNQAQSDSGEYSSVNETYRKCGFKKLTPYNGIRTDTTFVEWMLSDFWGGLINGERPRLFIVCRNPSDRPVPGLHPYDCPNLIWELKRARRVELSSRQLLTKNPSESIVDKTNHLRDCLKYITGTIRSGAKIPLNEEIEKQLVGLDPTTAAIRAQILINQAKSGSTFTIGQTGQVIGRRRPPTIDFRRRRRF